MCQTFSCLVTKQKKVYWKMGLVPSYDGKLWRLHGGKDAEILWEGKISEIK